MRTFEAEILKMFKNIELWPKSETFFIKQKGGMIGKFPFLLRVLQGGHIQSD